jgi:hypothetical protein
MDNDRRVSLRDSSQERVHDEPAQMNRRCLFIWTGPRNGTRKNEKT